MTEPRVCILCRRPMRPLTWFERLPIIGWLLAPPPFHDPSRDAECDRLFKSRSGL
jgi:hypothetical protein